MFHSDDFYIECVCVCVWWRFISYVWEAGRLDMVTYALKGLICRLRVDWHDMLSLNFVIMDLLRPPPATMKLNFRFSGVAFRWSQDKLHLQIFCLNISPNVASLLLLLHNMFYQNSYLCSLSIFFFQFGIFFPYFSLYWQSSQEDPRCAVISERLF